MALDKQKFEVKYVSSTDFLTWEKVIEADSIEEAHAIVSKKGKVICIKELSQSQ